MLGTLVGTVVLVGAVVLVVGGLVVVEEGMTIAAAGASAGAGFCHTDRGVDAPILGKSVPRIANAVPADPMSTSAATTAIGQCPRGDEEPDDGVPRPLRASALDARIGARS